MTKEPFIFPRLLSVKQAAEYCGITHKTFEHFAEKQLHINPIRIGKRKLYDVKAIDRALDHLGQLGPYESRWEINWDAQDKIPKSKKTVKRKRKPDYTIRGHGIYLDFNENKQEWEATCPDYPFAKISDPDKDELIKEALPWFEINLH